jgi:hypothetical protein
MNKITLSLGVFVVVAAMFAISNASMHFAQASNCSSLAQSGTHHASTSLSTNQGGCATSAAASHGKFASAGRITGLPSACESRSAGSTGVNSGFLSESTVSCGSQSP